jgi:acyl carrier protein
LAVAAHGTKIAVMLDSRIKNITMQGEESLNLVYAAIDDVNAQSPDAAPIIKAPETGLLGGRGLDSLTFVNLVVALEEQIQLNTRKSVVLVTEETMTLAENPFRTVATLAQYVQKVLASQPSKGELVPN